MQKNIVKTDIEIVEMREEHLDSVARIEKSVFHNPWSRAMYEAELMKDYSHHYVAIYDGEVIGYYGFFNTTEESAEVTNVAVDEDYQGNGIGDMLVESMLDNAGCLGISMIFLETRESNIRAQHLYEKYGFKVINVRKKYYDGVESALIYRWRE